MNWFDPEEGTVIKITLFVMVMNLYEEQLL